MQVVVGFSELLASVYHDQLDDSGRQMVRSIVSGAHRIEEIVDELIAGSGAPSPGPSGTAPAPVTPDHSFHGRREADAVRPLQILLVEDSLEHAQLIRALLAEAAGPGYFMRLVGSVRRALDALSSEQVDCVLLDLSLPDARDLEAVAQVRSTAPTIPVVVITSSADEGLALAAVREGAQDYLVKGHIDVEQLSRSIRWAVQRKALENELARNALHDALTQRPNRTLMLDRLRSALGRSDRSGVPVAVFFLDLDDFKPVNDRFGHDAGDRLLIGIAERLKAALRPQDTVARIGGDEFVVLCEGLGEADGDVETVRARLAAAVSAPLTLDRQTVQVTASIGVSLAGAERDADAVLREADLAMYQVKRARA